jgi:hypothetical protein
MAIFSELHQAFLADARLMSAPRGVNKASAPQPLQEKTDAQIPAPEDRFLGVQRRLRLGSRVKRCR